MATLESQRENAGEYGSNAKRAQLRKEKRKVCNLGGGEERVGMFYAAQARMPVLLKRWRSRRMPCYKKGTANG